MMAGWVWCSKRGRMLADGTTTIYAGENQYTSSFPLLNWTTLPGTTEVQSAAQDAESPEHACSAIREGDVSRAFVGGVSEGGAGATVMDFARASFVGESDSAGTARYSDVACANATAPQPGKHCDLAHSSSVGNAESATATDCAALCCANTKCTCWTWTTFEAHGGGACPTGRPCCWLKQSDAPLVPAANCTAGEIPGRPVPPPPPPPLTCLEAGKAWFFWGDAVIAMGSDINRIGVCAGLPLTTSIQQSNLLNSSVFVGGTVAGSTVHLADNSTHICDVSSSASCSWVWHNGLVYIILPQPDAGSGTPQSLVVSNAVRNGSEYAITQGDNTTLTGAIFSALLSHGPTAANQTYAYAVMPCTLATDAAKTAATMQLVPLTNRKPIQAACSKGEVLQAVVWPTEATLSVGIAGGSAGCWDVQVNSGAALALGLVVQLRKDPGDSSQYVISVAAPAIAGTVEAVEPPVATLWIAVLQLTGPNCTVSSRGSQSGTTVTVALDGAGGTASVQCAS
jgi:hypothetical protein